VGWRNAAGRAELFGEVDAERQSLRDVRDVRAYRGF